jgi:hypothetical protein
MGGVWKEGIVRINRVFESGLSEKLKFGKNLGKGKAGVWKKFYMVCHTCQTIFLRMFTGK